jgi:hypothetical protein
VTIALFDEAVHLGEMRREYGRVQPRGNKAHAKTVFGAALWHAPFGIAPGSQEHPMTLSWAQLHKN